MASAWSNTYLSFSGHDMVVTVEIPVDEAHGQSVTRIIGAFQTISYSLHNEKTPVRNVGNMNALTYVYGPRTVAGTMIVTVFNQHWMKEMLHEYNEKSKIYNNYLTDELPPMNITISMANEYGKFARLSLYGVTIVNEGQTMSVNDMYTENTYEFYAQDIDYLTPVNKKSNKRSNIDKVPYKRQASADSKDKTTQSKKEKSSSDLRKEAVEALSQPFPDVNAYADMRDYAQDLGKWYEDMNQTLSDFYNNGQITYKEMKESQDKAKIRYEKAYAVANKRYQERYKK